MGETADRVMMRLAETIAFGIAPSVECEPVWLKDRIMRVLRSDAGTLSSHGLRELIDRSIAHIETTKRVYEAEHHSLPALSKIAHQQLFEAANEHDKALTAVLGEGEPLKPEEQADG